MYKSRGKKQNGTVVLYHTFLAQEILWEHSDKNDNKCNNINAR